MAGKRPFLMAALALVYGLKKFKQAVKCKKHGAPQMSLFRWGLTCNRTT
jgi:hypothetical protein